MLYVVMAVLGFIGGYSIWMFYYLLYGLIYLAILWSWYKLKGIKPVRQETLLSPSSLPAMAGSCGSVYDYIGKLGNGRKKAEYGRLLTELRAVGLEAYSHPDIYPQPSTFCIQQLDAMIRKSSVAKCMETAKFRSLAIDVVAEMDVNDCWRVRK